MRKRILAFILAVCGAMMTGCTLAVPEGAAKNGEPDQLVGVYITLEYLDLFDMEGWLAENAGKLTGGSTILPEDTGPARLYGSYADGKLTFPGTEGMVLVGLYVPPEDPETDSGYRATVADPGMAYIHSSYHTGETTESIDITASIYYTPEAGSPVFYFNPVYQDPDGGYYVTSGQGMSMSAYVGSQMGQTLREESAKDGMTVSRSLDITIRCVELPEAIKLIQLSADHRILAEDTFTPETMPEEIAPVADTAYILVEASLSDGITRTLYQPGDDPIPTMIPMENGICDHTTTNILWQE